MSSAWCEEVKGNNQSIKITQRANHQSSGGTRQDNKRRNYERREASGDSLSGGGAECWSVGWQWGGGVWGGVPGCASEEVPSISFPTAL